MSSDTALQVSVAAPVGEQFSNNHRYWLSMAKLVTCGRKLATTQMSSNRELVKNATVPPRSGTLWARARSVSAFRVA